MKGTKIMTEVLLEEINEKSLEKLDKEVKMIPLTIDIMLKNILESNDNICKEFLINVLDLGISPDDCKIIHHNKELPLDNYKEYKKTVDFNIEINNSIFINMEMNRTNFNNVKNRNFLYHSKKTSTILKRGKKLKSINDYKVIQLNLNAHDKSSNIGEDIIVPYSIKTNSIYIKENKIYIRYLDYYRTLYYNEDIKKTNSDYWLAILTSENFTELNDIASKFLDTGKREKLVRDVLKFSMDEFILEECERIALDKIVEMDTKENARKEGLAEGRAEGRAKGRAEGREENTINIIKIMLKKSFSYKDISEISGKSINEIKEIEKSIAKD